MKMWELDYKEGWMPKNWCFWIVVLDGGYSWESLGLQGDQTSQPWIFIGRTDAEAEVPNTLATWCEDLLIGKERLKAEGEGNCRGWNG